MAVGSIDSSEAMGWTPPPLTASMCQTGVLLSVAGKEGVRYEA